MSVYMERTMQLIGIINEINTYINFAKLASLLYSDPLNFLLQWMWFNPRLFVCYSYQTAIVKIVKRPWLSTTLLTARGPYRVYPHYKYDNVDRLMSNTSIVSEKECPIRMVPTVISRWILIIHVDFAISSPAVSPTESPLI